MPKPTVSLPGTPYDLDGAVLTVPVGWTTVPSGPAAVCLIPPGSPGDGGCEAAQVLRVYVNDVNSTELLDPGMVRYEPERNWRDDLRATCAQGTMTTTDTPPSAAGDQLGVRRWSIACTDTGTRTVGRWIFNNTCCGAILHATDPALYTPADQIVSALDRTAFIPDK